MKLLKRTTYFSLLLLALTCLHHFYGAIVYHSHWRMHVVLIALPVMALIAWLQYAYGHGRFANSRSLLLIYLLVTALFPIALIGVYEGVYNHLCKNIVYLFTGNNAFFNMLYPPPVYEAPGNRWFEITGVLQALLAAPLLLYFGKLWTYYRHPANR